MWAFTRRAPYASAGQGLGKGYHTPWVPRTARLGPPPPPPAKRPSRGTARFGPQQSLGPRGSGVPSLSMDTSLAAFAAHAGQACAYRGRRLADRLMSSCLPLLHLHRPTPSRARALAARYPNRSMAGPEQVTSPQEDTSVHHQGWPPMPISTPAAPGRALSPAPRLAPSLPLGWQRSSLTCADSTQHITRVAAVGLPLAHKALAEYTLHRWWLWPMLTPCIIPPPVTPRFLP